MWIQKIKFNFETKFQSRFFVPFPISYSSSAFQLANVFKRKYKLKFDKTKTTRPKKSVFNLFLDILSLQK